MDNLGVSLRDFFEEKFKTVTREIGHVSEKADLMLDKQDFTNGRLKKLEIAVAILKWAYGIGAAIVAGYVFNMMKGN